MPVTIPTLARAVSLKRIAAVVAFGTLMLGSGQAQDAAAGKTVFVQCAACHSIDGATNVGPTLKGIDGRKAGSVAGFRYSRAMKNAGFNWDEQKLDAYIADPQKVVPGNVMPFSGLPEARQRADLVAYLKTLK
jgi:cytochrome c